MRMGRCLCGSRSRGIIVLYMQAIIVGRYDMFEVHRCKTSGRVVGNPRVQGTKTLAAKP